VAGAGAEEPELPQFATGPTTALARAERQADEIVVVLRVVDTRLENRIVERQVWSDVQVIENGSARDEKREAVVQDLVPVAVPKRFRELTLPAKAFHVRSVKGERITDEALLAALAKETPVLLNFEPSLDAFHLLTVREDVLILSTNRQRVFPPSAALPPAPVPPRAPQILPRLEGRAPNIQR
jgi:hypothetical protein